MQHWEYLILNLDDSNSMTRPNIIQMNSLGDQGWELVGVYTLTTGGGTYGVKLLFKRPK
jgi:hypothetical protein